MTEVITSPAAQPSSKPTLPAPTTVPVTERAYYKALVSVLDLQWVRKVDRVSWMTGKEFEKVERALVPMAQEFGIDERTLESALGRKLNDRMFRVAAFRTAIGAELQELRIEKAIAVLEDRPLAPQIEAKLNRAEKHLQQCPELKQLLSDPRAHTPERSKELRETLREFTRESRIR